MEKILCALWSDEDGDSLRENLQEQLVGKLGSFSFVHEQRLTVVDSAVDAAAGKRMASRDLPAAVLSVWLDEARRYTELVPILSAVATRHDAYLVTESEPLVNSRYPVASGERGHGFCQVVFLRRPAQLAVDEWLDIWQGSHTRIAIDTQDTFGYRQNVVVRALNPDAHPVDAIVEENFPPEAMTSDHAFYAAPDDETLARNMTAMMESCARFIDFEHIDVIPMSEYLSSPAKP